MDNKKLFIYLGIALGLGGLAYYLYSMGLFLPQKTDNSGAGTGTGQKKQYKINYIVPWGDSTNPDWAFTEISVERIADFAIGEMIKTTNTRFPGPYTIIDIWDSGSGHGSLKINLPFTGLQIQNQDPNAGVVEKV